MCAGPLVISSLESQVRPSYPGLLPNEQRQLHDLRKQLICLAGSKNPPRRRKQCARLEPLAIKGKTHFLEEKSLYQTVSLSPSELNFAAQSQFKVTALLSPLNTTALKASVKQPQLIRASSIAGGRLKPIPLAMSTHHKYVCHGL